MRRYCHNDATAAEHAHREGEQTRREIWEEQKREEIEKRLNAGESICIGGPSYTKAEILIEELETGDYIILAEAAALRGQQVGSEQTNIDLLLDRCDEIVSEWLDKHLADILAAEYEGAA